MAVEQQHALALRSPGALLGSKGIRRPRWSSVVELADLGGHFVILSSSQNRSEIMARELTVVFKIIFIVSCLLIGGNIYDLVGRDLFDFFWAISVYSWGTIGLIIVLLINWKRFPYDPGGVEWKGRT